MKMPDGTYHLDSIGEPPESTDAVVTDPDLNTTLWGAFTWDDDLGCYISLLLPEKHLYFNANGTFAMVPAPPPPDPVVGTWS